MMKNFNTKKVYKDDLYRYLGKRSSTNIDVTDDEIASIFSDKDSMILAADNATCEQINSFMARCQHGESKIYNAKY